MMGWDGGNGIRRIWGLRDLRGLLASGYRDDARPARHPRWRWLPGLPVALEGATRADPALVEPSLPSTRGGLSESEFECCRGELDGERMAAGLSRTSRRLSPASTGGCVASPGLAGCLGRGLPGSPGNAGCTVYVGASPWGPFSSTSRARADSNRTQTFRVARPARFPGCVWQASNPPDASCRRGPKWGRARSSVGSGGFEPRPDVLASLRTPGLLRIRPRSTTHARPGTGAREW